MPSFFIAQKPSGHAFLVLSYGAEYHPKARVVDFANYEEPLGNWLHPDDELPIGRFVNHDDLPDEVRSHPEMTVFNSDRYAQASDCLFFELGAAT